MGDGREPAVKRQAIGTPDRHGIGTPHGHRGRLVPVANRRVPRASRSALTNDGAARVGGACLPTGASRGGTQARCESALARWYQARTANSRVGTRKTMIVALARKLLIALWRFVTTGETLEGVILRPRAPRGSRQGAAAIDRSGRLTKCLVVDDQRPGRTSLTAASLGCCIAESYLDGRETAREQSPCKTAFRAVLPDYRSQPCSFPTFYGPRAITLSGYT